MIASTAGHEDELVREGGVTDNLMRNRNFNIFSQTQIVLHREWFLPPNFSRFNKKSLLYHVP